MFPTLLEIDGTSVALHTYGLLVLAGLSFAMALVAHLARSMGIATERLPLAFLAAAAGGLLGAKVLYSVATGDFASLVSATGGFAWYGGLLGGTAAVLALRPVLGVDVWKLADATVPAIALGAGFGRLGCLFAGCCHGVAIPHPTPATPLLREGLVHGQIYVHPHAPFLSTEFDGGLGHGVTRVLDVPLYPTQIWQSAGSFLLAGLLVWMVRHRRFDGQVAAVFLLTEPILRIVVEAFRGDERGYVVSWPVDRLPTWLPGMGSAGGDVGQAVIGLTTSQGIGLGMVILGALLLLWRRGQGVGDEVAPDDVWVDDLVDDG